ncbi:MAG: molybdate ABC transporter permease subunit [Myxococcales bacterium]|nr:molybdate ABC transporter permease subunit [Myxococcales bacterium]
MSRRPAAAAASTLGALLGAALLGLLIVPIAALALSSAPADIVAGARHPMFAPALWLSLRTTAVSLVFTVLTGTPLAWWLVTSRGRAARVAEVLIGLPIVIPPAVIGVALLQTFGRQGFLGPALARVGISIPFTEGAVLLAQVVVSAPFFVQAAANALRKVNPDTITVARTLGASPAAAFLRVAVPIAAPGLIVGASLAWARALGEFGATLLFAGNLTGVTQTMPLAIFSALEADVELAVVFSIVLAAMGALLLVALRGAPALRVRVGPRAGGAS